MDWRVQGLCLREDPDLFFPIGSVNSAVALLQTEEAKAVCRRCSVTRQCLAWAMDVGHVEGIWGGTTEGERRAMRRRAAHEREATDAAA
ncbi:WhiB family transcriptional regulator [Streptomyces sp. NRRL F-5123]|uniref:WhiB family transcriptional regulator n=1 Tax=Streptomyces sp. NRRL F-5123 TaxID=1463856 RepID=UPI0004E270B7|nr:WhiB family transcriptional regulator [Streptomyces sp. NRRL F-5123]